MRIFTLINASGETYNITSKTALLSSVSGLGLSINENYRQVGDRWVVTDRKPRQASISGSVIFAGDQPYQQYFEFVQFLSKRPLTLLYQPNNESAAVNTASGAVYRKSVSVTSLSKSELEQGHYLSCSITLMGLTPWYKLTVITNGYNENPLKWGVVWGLQWGDFNQWERGIVSDSSSNSPSKLTIYGPIHNPKWTHYVNGVEFETGKITANIDENEYLIVDNTVDPYVIQKRSAVNDSFIADLYESSDKITKRFVSLQNGTNTVSVTGDGVTNPYTKLEAYIYYDTV